MTTVNNEREYILKAVEPLRLDIISSNKELKAIFATLVGAAVSLHASERFLRRFTPSEPKVYDIESLWEDIKEAIQQDKPIRWDKKGNIEVWSIGYFINKAQGNVAAAIDRCIDLWLKAYTLPDKGYQSDKLTKILNIVTDLQRKATIQQLIASFMIYWSGKATSEKVTKVRENCYPSSNWHSLPELINYINGDVTDSNSTVVADSDCAVIVNSLVNRFKHEPAGLHEERPKIGYHLNWAIVAKGLNFTGIFWREMIKDCYLELNKSPS